jgi:DNA primase
MKEKLNILKEILGPYYKSREEYLFECPYCKHYKKKLSINLNLGVYKCWVCDSKGKNLQRLVRRFGPYPLLKKWRQLTNQIDMSEMDNLFLEEKIVEENQRLSLPEEFIFLGASRLPHEAQRPLRYLERRGLTLEDIRYYKLGFCSTGEYRNRIIIPSFDEEGYCNYFVGRTYSNDSYKYKNPRVSKNIIFNELLVDWSSPVLLVEGPFDALKARNAICILGSTLNIKSRLFAKLVEKQPPVYVGFDNDALQKSLRVIKNMLEYGLEVYQMDTSNVEDIGSLTPSEVEKLREEATPMSFESLIFSSCR